MYKIKHALSKSKPVFIMIIILWIILSIVFVAPMTVSKVEATIDGAFNQDVFFNSLWDNFSDIKANMSKVLTFSYIGTYLKGELYLIMALIALAAVGIIKSFPKNEYTDIEHGSSDWATGGEQYQVLSPKKGIILAEKNYLPVDKRGNVNVLVVGRFWLW